MKQAHKVSMHISYLFNVKWWSFQWRYQRRRTPWDTQVTPPEVSAFIQNTSPGRALDLGCGTGTNAIALARAGWHVTGIDFVAKAIKKARLKAEKERLDIDFQVGDVTHLDMTLDGQFDYALDIGCLHSIAQDRQKRYADVLSRLLRPKATFMLYAWLPRIWKGKQRGIAIETVHALFEQGFRVHNTVVGEESGAPSAWFWLTRRASL